MAVKLLPSDDPDVIRLKEIKNEIKETVKALKLAKDECDSDEEAKAEAELTKLKEEKKTIDSVIKAKLKKLKAATAAKAKAVKNSSPKKKGSIKLPSDDPDMKRLNEIKKEMKIVKSKIEEAEEAEDEDAEEEAEAELKKLKKEKRVG